MSQLALYRRYRPETFAEVIGQEHVTGPLQQALRNNRVNHAYLFSGPRGCGKTTSARILARCLNCEQGPTPTPCGECRSCQDLSRNGPGSIDVIEIDAASHGGVDDARELREKAFFGPASSRYKIYIIDEAHMVTSAGFNALLKVVEEPPEHLKFIFATTEPEKVIGTIRSRTHHYPFRLVPPGTLREYLAEVCGRESIPVEDGVLPLVVRAGAGSVRDSMSVMDQLLAGAADDGVTYAMATALLGYTDSALLDSVVDAFAAGDGGAAFEVVDRVIEGGGDPRRFVADLLERLRDLVILAAVPDAGEKGLIDVPEDVLERMRAQATAFGAAELSRAADLVNEGLTEMRGATSPRLQLELICARVLLPAAYGDERSVQARLDRLERGQTPAAPGVGYAPGPEAQPPGPAAARAAIADRGGPVVPGPQSDGDTGGGTGRQATGSQNAQAPQDGGPQDGGPLHAAPRGVGAQGAGPRGGGQQNEQGAGRQGADSRGADPQGAGSQGAGSQSAGFQSAGSQSAGPPDGGPQHPGPQAAGPQAAGPQATAPPPAPEDAPREGRTGAQPAPDAHQGAAPARRPGAWPTTTPAGGGGTGQGAGPGTGQSTPPARQPGAWPTAAEPGRPGQGGGPGQGGPGGGPAATGRPAEPSATSATQPATPQPPQPTRPPTGHPPADTPAAQAPAPGGPPTPQAGAASVRQMWPEILEAVKNRRRFTWILLSQNAQVSGFDGSTLQLGFANPGARDSFVNGGSAEVLQEALAEKFGVQWKIEAIVDPSGGGGGAQQPPPGPSPVRQPMQTAPPRPETPRPPAAERQAPPPRSYDEPEPPPPLEEDIPAEDDPDLDDTALSGHDLIVRELGATVIEEIRNEQ